MGHWILTMIKGIIARIQNGSPDEQFKVSSLLCVTDARLLSETITTTVKHP